MVRTAGPAPDPSSSNHLIEWLALRILVLWFLLTAPRPAPSTSPGPREGHVSNCDAHAEGAKTEVGLACEPILDAAGAPW